MINSKPNTYSRRWFESFHLGISDARTALEIGFISSFAPLPEFRRVVDVCCGMGRHARALTKAGYTVTGVDRDSDAIAKARELGGGPVYVLADLRDYEPKPGAYDAAIIMSQSFGHFDAATNREVLMRLAIGVRKRGRLILDLWHPDFFASHQGEREFETPGGIVRERKWVEGGRLFVHLAYPGGEQEDFEWQLFDRDDMCAIANEIGLALITTCTDFVCSDAAQAAKPRIQFVMERFD